MTSSLNVSSNMYGTKPIVLSTSGYAVHLSILVVHNELFGDCSEDGKLTTWVDFSLVAELVSDIQHRRPYICHVSGYIVVVHAICFRVDAGEGMLPAHVVVLTGAVTAITSIVS